ncbi:hypothetical protein N826_16685 [Skermanella aerolata KACC 11604]|nr:hypothetical protein N826_16685 [Skermanella aerolata KACC 11604]
MPFRRYGKPSAFGSGRRIPGNILRVQVKSINPPSDSFRNIAHAGGDKALGPMVGTCL